MRKVVLVAAFSFLFTIGTTGVQAQTTGPSPDENPTANTGALKAQIETGGSYDAHSGNATRIIPDLHVPGALGVYGLDFVRYWNSLRNDRIENLYLHPEPIPDQPTDFGSPGWSHSWSWTAEYDEYLEEQGGDGGPEIYHMSITITFPDGHASKYTITRSNTWVYGWPWVAPDPRFGPPYYASHGETNWPRSGEIHDYLEGMAQNGSEFWLHRADGGTVHFMYDDTWGYQAREVLDPHGLITTLTYDGNGHLIQVQQDGGRKLILTWSSGVITRVENPDTSPTQAVDYVYSSPDGWFTLASAIYHDEPVPGQTVSSTYTYQTYTPPSGFFFAGPLLSTADDPHFAGPMRSISYSYSGSGCLPPGRPRPGFEPYPGAFYDYYYASPTTIAAEKNLETGTTVSSFTLGCFDGTRTEYNGLGGRRKFFYGRSAGEQGSFHCMGYQLAKLTDFTNTYPLPSGLPFERQNFMNSEPRQIWDDRGILTETVYADGSGFPSAVRHVGSDGSSYVYDRIDPQNLSQSEPQDFSRVPNPYPHWLFSKTDERFQTTTYRRDSRRRVTDIYYHDGSAEHFTYNDLNQVLTHMLPSGAVETYIYDDTTHRLTTEYNSVDGPDARKDYTYDSLERVATVSDGRSRSAGKDFSTRMTYNGRHQILTVEYAGMYNAPNNPTVRYGYDSYGNCTSITDEMGHTSLYSYDSYRRCISYTEPLNAPGWNGGPNVASRRWDWLYDRWIDGLGWRDQSSHTKNEWRIQIEPAFNAAGERRMTARAHDLQNRVVVEQTGWIQPGNLPIGNWYQSPDLETHYFTYDANGQKSTYTDPLGRLTTYDYDLRNRLWKTNETVNTVPRTTETLYDTTGNKTMVKFPVESSGQRTQQWLYYDAFGQPRQFIDERNDVTDLNYWPWGPMKKLAEVITHRDRDSGGTEDQDTRFYYDLMGRPQTTVFPDGSFEYTHYDLAGQVDLWENRKLQIKRISYDARGREQFHAWDNNAAPRIDRTWDDASRMTSTSNVFSTIDYGYDAAGQPLYEGNTIAGSGGRVQTTYNRYADGAVSRIIYPNTLSVRHDYTARGQLAATGWSDSNNNWLIQFATYNYLADGKVNSEDYGNGMHTGFGYDGRGFVNQETISRNNQIYSQRTFNRDERDRITAFQKGSDNSANPMENGRGDRFRYDEEGQLVEAWYNAADPANSGDGATRYDNFSYDALGNRFGWDYVASRHQWMNFTRKDNGLNQYSGWWPYCFIHYDDDIGGTWGTPGAANGVLMQDGWITAGYNALNQPMLMTSAATGGNWMFFGYDPLGRCVKRWTGGLMPDGNVPPPGSNPATYFYYDGWGLIQEGPNASVISAAYILGNRIDEIVADFSMSNYQWLVHHSGARGHSTLLTDWGGNIVEQYEYDAFGHPYFYNGSNGWTGDVGSSGFGNRFLFTGREWLSDLKLYDYRNRMYQPELGRFLQPDPKEFGAGDYNLYRYCHNDPVNRTDPTGLGMWPPQYNPFIEEALKDELYHFLDDTREMLDNPSSFVGPGEIGMVESAGGRGPVGRILARFFPRLGSEHPLGRLASHPPGNFGIGSATRAKASALGHRWVGSGYRRASDGKTLISRDGLRQYRPPSFKPDLGKVQANFEERSVSKGPWEKNGHLDITN